VDRPSDVLQLPISQVFENETNLVAHLIMYNSAYANPVGVGEAFEARRNVYAIAIDVLAVYNDVAEVDADAELNSLVRRNIRIPILHRALDQHRELDGFDHAWELDQDAIASCLDNAALMLSDLGVYQPSSMRLERRQGLGFVSTHKSAIADHICRDDGGEFAGHDTSC
jgi:hypothetical protein